MTKTIACSLWPFLVSLLFSTCSIGSDTPLSTAGSSLNPAVRMNIARSGQAAILLQSGQLLIADGLNGDDWYFETSEIDESAAERFDEAVR